MKEVKGPTRREIGNCLLCKGLFGDKCLSSDTKGKYGECESWEWNGRYADYKVNISEDKSSNANLESSLTYEFLTYEELKDSKLINNIDDTCINVMVSNIKEILDKYYGRSVLINE